MARNETDAGIRVGRVDFGEQVLPGRAGKRGHVLLPERSWASLGQVSRDKCYLEKQVRGNRWYLQGQTKRTGYLQGTGTRRLMLPARPDVGN